MIEDILAYPEFSELASSAPTWQDWEVLEKFDKILAVSLLFIYSCSHLRCAKIPHAFQQILSAEKMPTLSRALLAFEALATQWEKLQYEYPEFCEMVEKGLKKLDSYRDHADSSPAYSLAMCKLHFHSLMNHSYFYNFESQWSILALSYIGMSSIR